MGNLSTVVKFSAVLFTCFVDFTWAENELRVTECMEGQGGCKRCRDKICARCAVLLYQGTCVDSCPPGHIADWSTRDEYMGKICKETGYMFGFTGSQVAILVGVISGATICILIILCGAIIVHRRKRKTAKFIQQFEDSSERREFLKHLALLRGEGNTFLSMLNDTRRQVRELYYSGNNGDGAVGIQAYRPVLRDLARILVLINRRDEEIPIPPDDWQRLFSWAERLLRRYKRHSSPEVAQLVTFLQQPAASVQSNTPQEVKISQSPRPYELRTAPTNLTTFQANIPLTTFQASDKSSISPASSSLGYVKDSPPSSSLGQNSSGAYHEKLSPNGSSIGQTTPLVYDSQKQIKSSNTHFQELAISTFNHTFSTGATLSEPTCGIGHCETNGLDPELNPQWEFHSSTEAANYTILSDWSPTREYLIDDFTILGFRPQDEITTEL
ncbi:FU domain-containing protein T48 isoform X1 [Halictus rubicundus]|uniref:FU domain-containing protein T48 isoform X1 n=2 Tax=Halictus rubicundus TaxID=77578 RepID=UPI0040375EA6